MIPGGSSRSCFPSSGLPGLSIYGVPESEDINQAAPSDPHSSSNPGNFLYNLSVLKDKVHQVESLATVFLSSDYSQHHQSPQSTPAIAIASMGTLIQEIIVTASSLMFTCQQVSLGDHSGIINSTINHDHQNHHPNPAVHGGGGGDRIISQFGEEREQGLYSKNDDLDWYGDNGSYNNHEVGRGDFSTQKDKNNEGLLRSGDFSARKGENNGGSLGKSSPNNYDIVELDAADLLAKYTHYCQVCGKGFKRDANLRMHMRAHGDEFKSSVALSNPLKNKVNNLTHDDDTEASLKLPRKYSCPHEGCRWNKNHAKFQPLKSMICVKNHYKRSHCPKMYVCKRCNRKQFSVLSDLRTHEKHCGDLKWQCSCGTTFSRKDKLLGHIALFVGHKPAVSSLVKMGKAEHQNEGQMQLDR